MIYAPVCIPTLNRYEHLRKCLESLSRCTWADQTEVYVALDYPPLDQWEKYAPGWEKNRDWLRSIGDFGFKKLHLIERKENYGIWTNSADKETNLGALLREYVRGKYDSYILTEDDNVFAPAFLDYMNKGLEHFKDDENVLDVCGYRHFYPIKYDNNSFFCQSVDYNAWGVGCWINKRNEIPKLDYKWFRSQLSIKNIIKVFRRNGPNKLIVFLNSCNSKWEGHPIDQHMSVYMTLSDKCQIMPVVSLVKNIGLDESGASFGKIDDALKSQFDDAPFSTDNYFEFVGTGKEYFEKNQVIYRDDNFNKMSKELFVKRLIKKTVKLILYP